MTKETFEVKKDMVSRYFHRDKWKDEAGIFQYPRGKRRIDAVIESLEIVFDKEEFTVEKELNLRGNNVLGNVFLVAITLDTGKAYMALTITDHVFALMMLPENCIGAFTAMENVVDDNTISNDTSKEESGSSNQVSEVVLDYEKEELEERKEEAQEKESDSGIDEELPITEEDATEEKESNSFEDKTTEKEAEEDGEDMIDDELEQMLNSLPMI